MCEVLEPAIQKIRDTHTPAIFHIEEITQPQGHSTSCLLYTSDAADE